MANSRSATRRRRESGALACMISAEVGAVLATMRRNSRWAGRYEEQLDHSLIYSLKLLRRSIFSWTKKPWNSINPCLYLAPFLDVVRSDETGAPITGTALSAVYKILTSDVFDLRTSHVDEAMHAIVESVTSCRFEVTDPASEEAVLMKILQVLLACIGGDMGAVLGHRDVCNVVNTTFRVVHQAGNKSELLQRVARHTMHELVRAIFGHLSSMDPLAGNNGLLVPWSNVENNVGVIRYHQGLQQQQQQILSHLSLAQQCGLVKKPRGELTEEEWRIAREQSMARRDALHGCPICHEIFIRGDQLLLSCSHIFHKVWSSSRMVF
ncbi:ARF guanine-nucleotide exchange factor GNOM isoform X2 [Selaginella moellendorffii]|uniref:ARF guanine-nucleotide exchange factor GNOM isoform X2 n=1 Tax=Selaginella moellendorffii TaxID=88036 RepID=UPI000D1C9237|nr:ARF guanine-nucleotide exchange factor GNOM isoform X2 [Selaginella moellendorffii]|eukprot:XP_024515282.1 ARF guanine-nucleotide exchange factor GNOM isoform X2 [Selaginella moellendorffii]